MWRHLRKFGALGFRRQALLTEAMGLVAFASMITRLSPYRLSRRLYGSPRRADGATMPPVVQMDAVDPRIRDVAWALRVVMRITGSDKGCLPRAIAGRIMLRRRGFAPTLVIGTRRDADRVLAFHAWLLEHGRPVTGVRAGRQFTALAVFETE